MRIGIMLRTFDEKGGIGVYSRNLVQELLSIDYENQYTLFYRSPEHLGNYQSRSNVIERHIPGANKLIWDQIMIPIACRREKIDVLFHPKFTVPLFAPCKTIMVVHGADWFMPDQAQYYDRLDAAYIRAVMPLYFKKCSRVISVSELTTQNFYQVLDLPPGKIKTIYFGPAKFFKPISDPQKLRKVKQQYNLPDDFILTLTKIKGDGRKNFGQLIAAYADYHQSVKDPAPLVVGGKDCHLFKNEYSIPDDGFGRDIHFPGWIHQEDLPAVYNSALVFLYPSNLEAFPIPITEAMACGTPIITSNVNGLIETAGDSALFVNPQKPSEIAEGIRQMLRDQAVRQSYSRRGLARSKHFTWDKCAAETLVTIDAVYKRKDP